MTENITFPQPRWRAVIIDSLETHNGSLSLNAFNRFGENFLLILNNLFRFTERKIRLCLTRKLLK